MIEKGYKHLEVHEGRYSEQRSNELFKGYIKTLYEDYSLCLHKRITELNNLQLQLKKARDRTVYTRTQDGYTYTVQPW